MQFNGTTDMVLANAGADFDRPSNASFTMTAWVQRVGTFDHSQPISIATSTSGANYAIEMRTDTTLCYWDNTNHHAETTVAFPLGTWHHTAVVVQSTALGDGGVSTSAIYFDGEPTSSGLADTTPATANAVWIGAGNDTKRFPRIIDNVRFYNRALSAAEIQFDMTH